MSFMTQRSFAARGSGWGGVGIVLAVLLAVAAAVAAAAAAAQDSGPAPILVSRQLAELERLAPGDIVRLATDSAGADARLFRVAGLYEPTPDPMRLGSVPREVRMHLPDLLAFSTPSGSTRGPGTPAGTEHVEAVNIALVDPDDAELFARDVNARLPGVIARSIANVADGPDNPFLVLERFHLAIAIVTIVAATVFLLALTIMLVDERRETVGVLRLIGLPVRRILAQVFLEGVLIAGAGAAFGLLLAVASEGLINRFFQWRYNTALVFVRVTPDVAAICLAIAVPLGAAATVIASWALLRRSGLRLARR
jgi:putative ABC transport system permease protein